jgi:DNA-binding NtrC family response regulator
VSELLAGGTLERVVRTHVEQTLAQHKGNRSTAARELGVSRSTLHRWINAWAQQPAGDPAPLPGTDGFLNEEHF